MCSLGENNSLLMWWHLLVTCHLYDSRSSWVWFTNQTVLVNSMSRISPRDQRRWHDQYYRQMIGPSTWCQAGLYTLQLLLCAFRNAFWEWAWRTESVVLPYAPHAGASEHGSMWPMDPASTTPCDLNTSVEHMVIQFWCICFHTDLSNVLQGVWVRTCWSTLFGLFGVWTSRQLATPTSLVAVKDD